MKILNICNTIFGYRKNGVNEPRNHITQILFRRDRLTIRVRMIKTNDFQVATFDFTLHLIKKHRIYFKMLTVFRPSNLIGRLSDVANSNGVLFFAKQNTTTFLRVGLPGLQDHPLRRFFANMDVYHI